MNKNIITEMQKGQKSLPSALEKENRTKVQVLAEDQEPGRTRGNSHNTLGAIEPPQGEGPGRDSKQDKIKPSTALREIFYLSSFDNSMEQQWAGRGRSGCDLPGLRLSFRL